MANSLAPKTNSSFASLQFPSHYEAESGHWMTFTRMKYARQNTLSSDTLLPAEGGKVIRLPVPAQLAKSYGAQWDNVAEGVYGNTRNNVAGKSIDFARDNSMDPASMYDNANSGSIISSLKSLVTAYGTSLATENDTFQSASSVTGLVRNPFLSKNFQSVNFRNFSFSFALVANSYEEAKVIREIIKQFNTAMAPAIPKTDLNSLYTYPDIIRIEFEKPEFLFKFSNCILTECTVNYHNEGSAIYFSKGEEKIPASVAIDLSFSETKILTKEDFEEGNY